MDILLNILVCFGLLSVGLAFMLLLPLVGNLLVSVFATVYTEQLVARIRGLTSGTVLVAPAAPEATCEPRTHGPAPIKVYVGVYAVLLILTVLTVAVSELGLLMREAVFWAVVLASLKGCLVVAWFMHVRGGAAMNRLVLGTTLFFMVVFFTLTMADMSTRDDIFESEAHWATIKEAQDAGSTPAGWSTSTSSPERQ